MNPAFAVANQAANNISQSFKKTRDQNAIEGILSQAMDSGDPAVLQSSIGKILSQVSPERQGPAIAYLQNTYQNLEKQRLEAQGRLAAKEGGYTYGAPNQVAAAQVREKAKSDRLSPYGLSGSQGRPSAQSGQNLPQEESFQDETIQDETIQDVVPTGNAKSPLEDMTESQLIIATGSPDREISEPAKVILRKKLEETKEARADIRAAKNETLPLKQEIITRANASRESIRNKEKLIDIIDRGNLDDPTFAAFAELLPFNLGKRLLSEDTVEYKGGLVDEFSDLKNIFKGATRVKEVEIYENKLADIYLTDSQKKAILKSRINTAKIDLLREEAAAEVEEKYPNISALQFNKKVDELLKPKLNDLFDNIWGDQKSIIDQSEARKKIPLDYDDPEGKQILDQILKEAGGNRVRAREIAKKKGYTIGS